MICVPAPELYSTVLPRLSATVAKFAGKGEVPPTPPSLSVAALDTLINPPATEVPLSAVNEDKSNVPSAIKILPAAAVVEFNADKLLESDLTVDPLIFKVE